MNNFSGGKNKVLSTQTIQVIKSGMKIQVKYPIFLGLEARQLLALIQIPKRKSKVISLVHTNIYSTSELFVVFETHLER